MSGEIDRLLVSQLSERYNLVRSAVYKRLEALGIKPERVGNKAYVNAEQIARLDDLHEFIQAGGTTAEYQELRGIQKPTEPPEQSSGLSTISPDLARFVAAIATEIVSRFQPQPPEPSPYSYYEVLEQAYRNGWVLKTSEIADLLDLLPSEMRHYGDSFSEAGFVFTKAGYRVGGEVGWQVSKPVK